MDREGVARVQSGKGAVSAAKVQAGKGAASVVRV